MQKFIKNIEDPAKVAAIQKFFGVTYKRKLSLKANLKNEYSQKENTYVVQRTSLTYPLNHTDTKIYGRSRADDYPMKNTFSRVAPGSEYEFDQMEGKNYTIKYRFWYYFFISVTYLGDVIGYALVLPFLFWNVDAVIARKLVLVWTAVMYVGQAVKEVVCRERPECPPVIRLQKRWSEEYGMPSTHAMASVALSASLIYYGIQRYKFHLSFAIIISLLWCILISFSRLYLGMHSILDIIVGFLLSYLLLIPLLPMMDYLGDSLIEYSWSPLVILILSIFLIFIYPKPKGPVTVHTKSDSISILATCVGVEIGCFLNYQLNIVQKSKIKYLYLLNVPGWRTFGLITLRTVLGLICIFTSFFILELVKKFTYLILNKIEISRKNVTNSNRKIPLLEMCSIYLVFGITSLHVTFSIPFLFKILNIHRPSYLTE